MRKIDHDEKSLTKNRVRLRLLVVHSSAAAITVFFHIFSQQFKPVQTGSEFLYLGRTSDWTDSSVWFILVIVDWTTVRS